ncbi:CopD family protein [Pigmentiphaga litoralis]|uniref:Protoporphyrinogen IX oxidase n=1 Tax=Pigmentiphaga litoralis TaxID=516702 RepID=A0A7Y9IRT9_9BURK|nr:CopD family protein [Pigmentiphaga litoralis]NYE24600.1 putative membrane protein [Pigmentiphaga litoralis]NYE81786.1 putative membrane protein [Pigmentiphaga litoralis]
MTLASSYVWLKAFHVASALVFVGGLVGTSVFIRSVLFTSEAASAMAETVRRWDRRVTLPAMLLAWGFGIALAFLGGWTGTLWLPAKAALVVVLSAVHGIQAGQLRRIVNRIPGRAGRTGPLIVCALIAIAILAVVKPS